MSQPDIVFIVLDTQRADRLGVYGHDKAQTPNLDRFAGQAALFERAIAPAQWTIPSHASMFTGLYPTAHQVTQSHHSLSPDWPHLAETLHAAGYQTVGFCNNPLVGILNNGLKRGFQTFYNYGGAFPSIPERRSRWPWPINRLTEAYTQFLRRISYPIQNYFGRSELALRIALNAWLTPLWSRYAHFKGQNALSVEDTANFLERREQRADQRPLFLFLNLMETHLPFWPPNEYIDRVAPYLRKDREARSIMRRWNREAYRWAAPLAAPLPEMEARVLSDLYDAEVAYQDAYLGQLFAALAARRNADNTLTIIVGDHGDGLGEHNYVGHAFNTYQELVHVPLLVHWPAHIASGTRIPTSVSTRRVYHTMVDAARALALTHMEVTEPARLSLMRSVTGPDPEKGTAYAEAIPPLNFIRSIERRQPELLERYRCLDEKRAVVRDSLKLIQVDATADELFDLDADPLELNDIMDAHAAETIQLDNLLRHFAGRVNQQRDALTAGQTFELEDEHLIQQLRSLGYLD